MKKSGLADSPLFAVPKDNKPIDPPLVTQDEGTDIFIVKSQPKDKAETKKPSNRDTATPRYHGTTVSRYHETIIELVLRHHDFDG